MFLNLFVRKAILAVKHRPLNDQEMQQQNQRSNMLNNDDEESDSSGSDDSSSDDEDENKAANGKSVKPENTGNNDSTESLQKIPMC